MFCEHATISTPADECKQQVDSDYWSLDNRVKRLMLRMGPEVQEAMNDNSLTPLWICLLYTSPSPRDGLLSRMPSSA